MWRICGRESPISIWILHPTPLFRFLASSQVMAGKRIIAICQLGGEFETNSDGSLSYRGGDAHAIDIDDQMKFNEFKMEVAEMFNCSIDTMYIKYFLPGNNKTLITISNDKDLKRMIKFHGDSVTADVYVIMEEIVALDVSNLPASRSSRTTLSETVLPVDAPLDIVDGIVDDTTQPEVTLDAALDIVDDTNHVDTHMIIPAEISPIFSIVSSNEEKHAKGAQQWQNTITGVGQRFNSVHEFRESLRKYAIAHQFAFRYKKNDSHRVTVKCKAEGCPWRIHASRQKGLRESIADIFTGSYHAYCLRYLTEQFIRDLKGQFSHEVKRLMIEDFYAAAYAPTPESFQRSIESIKSISLEAYNWIVQSEPLNWANSYFHGARYNHMTSNFGELFYSWASDAHELPITQMVDVIRGKIMELIYTRRADSIQWLTRLTPSMEEKLKKENHKVPPLQVLLSAGSTFEVRGDTIEMVDIDHWDCSCKGWQLTGLPCCHAIAVLGCMGRSPYDYCSSAADARVMDTTSPLAKSSFRVLDIDCTKGQCASQSCTSNNSFGVDEK
ncbi:hypothetical protein CMV_016631 [Castanea mollissima]|uniref:SWIM-type domain-containing protein n=1 Tax=Castanea mollissima TaxID=60419 RepID=A0A8J4R3K9_9ROSI|nr:hypothetical protein CMV_016631 [Castanea mollissima]